MEIFFTVYWLGSNAVSQHLAENGFAQNAFGNARISDLRAAAAQQKLITMQ